MFEIKDMKKDKVEVGKGNKKALYCDLRPFCPGYAKKDDFIEITEWINGEGFDVLIETDKREKFSLTLGQYDALEHLVKELNKL